MENRPSPLRSRRVCRFCLTEAEPLSFIYERDHNKPFQVPLTLQIMSCVAIEVSGPPPLLLLRVTFSARQTRFFARTRRPNSLPPSSLPSLPESPLSGISWEPRVIRGGGVGDIRSRGGCVFVVCRVRVEDGDCLMTSVTWTVGLPADPAEQRRDVSAREERTRRVVASARSRLNFFFLSFFLLISFISAPPLRSIREFT